MKLDCAQLTSLLEENTLRIVSEYILFEVVLKWIRYDGSVRHQYTSQLMEKVRLPLLSGEELVEKVSLSLLLEQLSQIDFVSIHTCLYIITR